MAKVIHNVVGLLGLLIFTTTQTGAIRVYWNTNTGPIVPPTTTPIPVPQPPFRDPAPVWEDQSDDVPNPNPYVYILPPPSRPKYNDITLQQRKQNQQESTVQPTVIPTTSTSSTRAPVGKIIETPDQLAKQVQKNNNNNYSQSQSHPSHPVDSQKQQPKTPQHHQHSVPSLAVQYVPNQGYKYYAVVPVHNDAHSKSAYLKTNNALLGKHEQYDKPNGRYNAKLKKYKAFEKVKYVPYFMIIALFGFMVAIVVAYEDHHPKYKYEYGVKDGHTHDHKSQWEHRDGDVVKGQYTLDEADGTHRVVDYSSDHHHGFQAHVQRKGHGHHPHGESYANIDQHH